MYTEWSHPSKDSAVATLAYHINITEIDTYPVKETIQMDGLSYCILYQACIMEETLAGIGNSACVTMSSNISGKQLNVHVIIQYFHSLCLEVMSALNT